ncbi:MAG: hypothetical protein CM15mP3_02040 [Candidatus Poseidoniales archaeon]|jgi:hypothetical protein|nr:DUF1844 domain-containing protein [Candidatus Poseidoniaceae archaeon]MEC7239398.1 DUF1844 domain-containing protein [Candidatus Thermoplasmatota archaeon]MEC7588969.1 DUF1844 domain-containing protein [Candidatus Thermoplasmatota archaeon]MEE3038604.1 DUF1844 domain-containing protein [Candidatus Thermoplasmatota archaeon]GIQ97170.1 MAG: hypothetical protein CM15mP3_02040 [Candidatus Poseidoniales archaeon]
MAEIFSDEDTTRLFQLVHMFQRSALLHMGYIPDQNGNKYYDLAEAKEAIDLLSMLQNKTKGNLNDKETQLLRSVISELQLQFTRAPTMKRQADDDLAESETIRETFANPRDGPVEDLSADNEEE